MLFEKRILTIQSADYLASIFCNTKLFIMEDLQKKRTTNEDLVFSIMFLLIIITILLSVYLS